MEPQQTNGYWVIGFPGAIMQKDNMAHRDREGGREACVIQNRKRIKFSLKCDDHMATTLGVNPLNPHRSNSPSAEVKLNNKKHGPL